MPKTYIILYYANLIFGAAGALLIAKYGERLGVVPKDKAALNLYKYT